MRLWGLIGAGFGGAADYPQEGNVRAGIGFNFGTNVGNLVVPLPAVVKLGELYGTAGSEFTGSYGPVPSPAGQTTGYLTCYDENGIIESGTEVTIKPYSTDPNTGGQVIDLTPRTALSDGAGLVQFPNLLNGVTYQIWKDPSIKYRVKIPKTAGETFELPSIIG